MICAYCGQEAKGTKEHIISCAILDLFPECFATIDSIRGKVHLAVLVNRIFEYTEKLAKDNSIELTEEELNTQISEGTIPNLQRYLKAQKRIFETAA